MIGHGWSKQRNNILLLAPRASIWGHRLQTKGKSQQSLMKNRIFHFSTTKCAQYKVEWSRSGQGAAYNDMTNQKALTPQKHVTLRGSYSTSSRPWSVVRINERAAKTCLGQVPGLVELRVFLSGFQEQWFTENCVWVLLLLTTTTLCSCDAGKHHTKVSSTWHKFLDLRKQGNAIKRNGM